MYARLLNCYLDNVGEALRRLEEVRRRGTTRAFELFPFIVNVPLAEIPRWAKLEEIEAAINRAARVAVERLVRGRVHPGLVLADNNAPPELRSQAARSMLAMRGGRATAAKMCARGFPNLVNARAVRKRRARLAREAE